MSGALGNNGTMKSKKQLNNVYSGIVAIQYITGRRSLCTYVEGAGGVFADAVHGGHDAYHVGCRVARFAVETQKAARLQRRRTRAERARRRRPVQVLPCNNEKVSIQAAKES